MDGKNELQLLPGTKKRLGIKVPGENRFLYIGSAILGATLVTMFAFGRYQSSLESQVNQLNNQLSTLEQSRNRAEEQNLKLFKDRVQLTSDLLNDHVYWTKALGTIVGLLQGNVRFKSLVGHSDTGKIDVNVQASSYSALAKQVASFLTESSITDISVGKIAPTTEGILETSFEIDFNSAKLLKNLADK